MIITPKLFSQLMNKMNVSGKMVVGLSGGADSLCLTLLLNEYCHNNIFACIVDHKLRPTSSTEIIPIIDILERKNINYCVKIWKHDKITGNLEQKARIARYDLLHEYCNNVKADVLCTAHHALDQWETFFMRLSRGSGLRGLSAIHPITNFRNIKILRPLLAFSPQDLKETLLQRFGIDKYVHDEMNDDEHYERVRWRKAYLMFKNYELTTASINATIRRLNNANSCLDDIAERLVSECFNGNYLELKTFCHQPLELQIRILNGIVQKFTPRIMSYELLERMANEIIKPKFSAINFAKLIFCKDRTKNIKIFPENR